MPEESDPATTELKVLTSNATRSVLDTLTAKFERETLHAVSVQSDSARLMLARIKSGDTADIAVLNAPHVEELVKLGRITPESCRPFARSRVGVAVREGARHPDISSVAAFRRTLLEAQSVAHTVHGASGMYFPRLIERLGIADEITPKTVTRPGGLIAELVAAGEAEIAVQQISELLAVTGVELVGPLPDEVQMIFESAAGIFADSRNTPGAEALLRFFLERSSATVLEEKGLEPVIA